MDTWVTLENGQAVAIRLDGIIYRIGSDGGNMIIVRDTHDFGLFSFKGQGAAQGTIHEEGRQRFKG